MSLVERMADLVLVPVTTARARQHVSAVAPERDLSGHQAAWTARLELLLEQWQAIGAAQRAELGRQIADAIDDGKLAKLADLSVDSAMAASRLHEALTAIAASSAADVVAEAAADGVIVPPVVPPAAELETVAVATAGLLATGLAVAAGREALRRVSPEKAGQQVASEVKTHLAEQSDAGLRTALGGALTGTQNRSRLATYSSGPIGSLYADEQLDGNTCGPCAAINGRFIATTDDMAVVDKLYTSVGGYVDCLGGPRCRGTVTGAWRPQTRSDA